MGVDAWFHNIWRTSYKNENSQNRAVIGVLAFEVASLMSKLIQLWQCLRDEQVKRLREEMVSSVGIKKLVAEDDDYIVQLICAELTFTLGNVSRAVARLGKRCSIAGLNSLDLVFFELGKSGVGQSGEFTWKKMESQVKKMERHISLSANLYQEMEVLSELEQTFKRISACSSSDNKKNLLEYQKKISRKRQEVRNLQESSLWGKSFDYIVSIMMRSVFTIFSRIKYVFGVDPLGDISGVQNDSGVISENNYSSHSLAALMQSSVHPSENNTLPRFSSGPLWKASSVSVSGSDSGWKSSKIYKSFSGPLGSPGPRGLQNRGGKKAFNFHSGPLAKPSSKPDAVFKRSIFGIKLWQSQGRHHHHHHHNSSTHKGKYPSSQSIQSTPLETSSKAGTLDGTCSHPAANGCSGPNDSGSETPSGPPRIANSEQLATDNDVQSSSCLSFNLNRKVLDPPPETLGAAALALHYANIIIVIEKLAASPHLIGHDARDDLYSMLPLSVRSALREKLKPYSKSPASSMCLADEWGKAISRILEWLAPLAHNTIRWQSERSYEQQNMGARTGSSVLLVQTLYYADQEKTEHAVTELLVGLNYVWRFGREIEAKAFLECAGNIRFGDYLNDEDS